MHRRFLMSFGGKLIMGFALATAAVTAQAATRVVECRGCTYQSMYSTVVNRGAGTCTIWNPVNAEIYKFKVACGGVRPNASLPGSSDEGVNATGCFADEQTVSQADADMAANLSVVFNATSGSYKAAIEVNANSWIFPGWTARTPTASDYVTDGNLRGMLNDKLRNEALLRTNSNTLVVALAYVAAHADTALNFTDQLSISVKVVFVDGSKVEVKLKIQDPPEYVKGSARDDTGQVVPDANSSDYTGTWTYGRGSEGSRDRMVRTFELLGALIEERDNGGYILRCNWETRGGVNRLTCKLRKS